MGLDMGGSHDCIILSTTGQDTTVNFGVKGFNRPSINLRMSLV